MSPGAQTESGTGGAFAPDRLRVEEYLQVPYEMVIFARRTPSGEWVRHVEYPELPGCFVESLRIVEAMEALEAMKTAHILDRLARGEPVPVPRPPLRA